MGSQAGSKDANRENEVGHSMNVNDVDDEQSQQAKCRRQTVRTTWALCRGSFPDAEGQSCQWAIDDLSSRENVGREEHNSPSPSHGRSWHSSVSVSAIAYCS